MRSMHAELTLLFLCFIYVTIIIKPFINFFTVIKCMTIVIFTQCLCNLIIFFLICNIWDTVLQVFPSLIQLIELRPKYSMKIYLFHLILCLSFFNLLQLDFVLNFIFFTQQRLGFLYFQLSNFLFANISREVHLIFFLFLP